MRVGFAALWLGFAATAGPTELGCAERTHAVVEVFLMTLHFLYPH